MNHTVLVVEDDKYIATLLKSILEENEYKTLLAKNGREGLKILSEQKAPPALIISDIMMPEMDGYEFFTRVSENNDWYDIPFVFLTSRDSLIEIRYGKKMGVDDYITKRPFREEDILACVEGKIKQSNKYKNFQQFLREKLNELISDIDPETRIDEKESTYVFLVSWDDAEGIEIEKYYTKDEKPLFDAERLSFQLFQLTTTIYGDMKIAKSVGTLLRLENMGMDGFVFIDSAENAQNEPMPFLLIVLALRINYLESLRIEEIFRKIANKIKRKQEWSIEQVWSKIVDVLSHPIELED